MKVLVLHNRYRSEQPSGENNVVDQEAALLAEAGHDVGLFEKRSDDIAEMSLPRKAVVPLQVPWNRAVRAELARRLRDDRPDVVHVHNTFPLLSPSVLAACADAGVPTVATVHNYTLICPPGTLYRDGQVCTDCVGRKPIPAVRHGCYRGSGLATVPMAASLMLNRNRWWSGVARFFCISRAQREVLISAGMPAERLTVKYNYVDDPGRTRTGAGEHVLFLGRITAEKGIGLLMTAWDRLTAAGGPLPPLVIAGTGPMQDEVARWAHGRDDVRYVGLQSKEECRDLVARSTAVVAPSEWLETFGLVVVEAMAAGVPTVAAAHGAFRELVEDGVTGLLHEPGNADSLATRLREIVADAERNQQLGWAARLVYEQEFTPKVGLERLVGGYQAAIDVVSPA
ncbi:glycosyltransferase family 4 protein [Amycolatopsis regifaucium]|uniref:Glycosyl transferase n=1 Tax=Amycolatopsis regifaucium TaxID=546365 RepID=A0A154MCF9_9PSEU|nr:glycosyltransferase family 4 protein [Amycolatopsis regifaucium]KZB81963.1 glycosyl transferase [Amycolatopsis regifaucium]OKA05966.1 glycosyl transferase [Amycolatopsis regifaucium]SFG77978.1 Glycosyltransferase involved in cell wall bisynthesis [Amycolatopsis regifaucium]